MRQSKVGARRWPQLARAWLVGGTLIALAFLVRPGFSQDRLPIPVDPAATGKTNKTSRFIQFLGGFSSTVRVAPPTGSGPTNTTVVVTVGEEMEQGLTYDLSLLLSKFPSSTAGADNSTASLLFDAGVTFHLTKDFSVYALAGAGILAVTPQEGGIESTAVGLAAALKAGINWNFAANTAFTSEVRAQTAFGNNRYANSAQVLVGLTQHF